MKKTFDHKTRLLLALGVIAWSATLMLRHAGLGGQAVAGFCLGAGVSLQLGTLISIQRARRTG